MQKIKKVINQLKFFIWPFLVLALICIFVKLSFSKTQIYFFINGLHFSFGDQFFPKITFLGAFTFTLYITAFLLLFVSYRSAFLMGTSYLFTAAINFPLKYFFYSPRPSLFFSGMRHDIYFVPGIEVLENNYSFPSGHTVCAFTGAVVASYLLKQKYGSFLFLFLALLVGYSRMYMSEHFFEDVFAGMVVGTSLTIVWLSITQRFTFLNAEKWQRALFHK